MKKSISLIKRPKPILILAETKSKSMLSLDAIADYQKLAKKLEFQPPRLIEYLLILFFAEKKIRIYNYGEVDEYLTNLAIKANAYWIWKPFRDYSNQGMAKFPGHSGYDIKQLDNPDGHGSCSPYHHLYNQYIPFYILMQVKEIDDYINHQVQFYVSDYAAPKPDPFVMVTTRGIERFIFGAWDEPGF